MQNEVVATLGFRRSSPESALKYLEATALCIELMSSSRVQTPFQPSELISLQHRIFHDLSGLLLASQIPSKQIYMEMTSSVAIPPPILRPRWS